MKYLNLGYSGHVLSSIKSDKFDFNLKASSVL